MKFTLNGKEIEYSGNLSARLLDVLRDEYRLTGVKCGCKEGECGACAVIIEGFRETPQFNALDEAFAEFSAVQCGYCIPGMILAAHSILCKNPNPTEEEIRTGISGNLCRCTGYNAIVNAIVSASKSYPYAEEEK